MTFPGPGVPRLKATIPALTPWGLTRLMVNTDGFQSLRGGKVCRVLPTLLPREPQSHGFRKLILRTEPLLKGLVFKHHYLGGEALSHPLASLLHPYLFQYQFLAGI